MVSREELLVLVEDAQRVVERSNSGIFWKADWLARAKKALDEQAVEVADGHNFEVCKSALHNRHCWCIVQWCKRNRKDAFFLRELLGVGRTTANKFWETYNTDKVPMETIDNQEAQNGES